MKKWKLNTSIWMLVLALLPWNNSIGQESSLTLEKSQEMAVQNYPLVKRRDLISKAGEFSVQNIQSGFLPGITINGQYTYQSDVTHLPIELPNMQIPMIDQGQYKVYAEVNQVIYDGGSIKNQKQVRDSQTQIEQQSLEVELYKIKERVNQVYFGILLLNGQISQAELLRNDIKAGLSKTEAAYNNGIVLKSNVNTLKAELLKIDQRIIELTTARDTYLAMLSLLVGKKIDRTASLELPPDINLSKEVNRPEIGLFNAQTSLLNSQAKTINSRNMPRVNLFLQAGYGAPALNMLNPEADTYYITGIRFAFPLNGLYNIKREKAINMIEKQNVDIQKETFLFNTSIQSTQQEKEIEKLRQLIETDDEIVNLRTEIKNAAVAQLENGVITSSDYLREANAEDNARQSKLIHEIQYLLSSYNYQLILGK